MKKTLTTAAIVVGLLAIPAIASAALDDPPPVTYQSDDHIRGWDHQDPEACAELQDSAHFAEMQAGRADMMDSAEFAEMHAGRGDMMGSVEFGAGFGMMGGSH